MDKVISVKPLENSLLEIEFADGFCKVINIRPFIGKGISAALNDEFLFPPSDAGRWWRNCMAQWL